MAVDITFLAAILANPMLLCLLNLAQFLKLIDLVASLSTHKRKKYNRQLVDAYHNQQHAPLCELMLRLLYETSVKLLGRHDFRSNTTACRWFTNPHREPGHKQRIQLLVYAIQGNREQLKHAMGCNWLEFHKL